MKIQIKGEMSLTDVLQALHEKLHELEDDYAVRHVKGVALYMTPTNGFGDELVPHNRAGHRVDVLYSEGPYHSVADDYKL